MYSFDEISEIIFEIGFASFCSIDGVWLDFLLMYKGLSLGFYTIGKFLLLNQNGCQENRLFLAGFYSNW